MLHLKVVQISKAKQLRLKTTPFFSREKEELPQVGFEPAMFCVLGLYAYMYIIISFFSNRLCKEMHNYDAMYRAIVV